jgi:hypothetical protein
LLLLPVVVGSSLSVSIYWDEWRKHRPPYKDCVSELHATFDDFVDDLRSGRLERAYDSTSDRFKKLVSRRPLVRMDDSFFQLRPSPPRVEEVRIQEWTEDGAGFFRRNSPSGW